jgi:uncharacterized protein (DUF2225 family)
MVRKGDFEAEFNELPRELYLKEFTCTFCGVDVTSPQLKASAATAVRREPDFRTVYGSYSPLHYAIIVCPECSFAAEKGVFDQKGIISDMRGLQQALAQLHRDYGSYNFARSRDLPAAASSFEMAWTAAQFLAIRHYQIGGLALRCAWVYRDWVEMTPDKALTAKVNSYLRLAINHYVTAYEHENPTELKLGAFGIGYLVGELSRQVGDLDTAMTWLTRVATNRSASPEVRRLAREQLDITRNERNLLKETGEAAAPARIRQTERSIFSIYRDQARWLEQSAKADGFTTTNYLRGLLDALMEAKLDMAELRGEDGVREYFKKLFGEKPKGGGDK